MIAREQSPRAVFAVVCLTSLANLGLELVLTRIFSVTTQYHFAFLCISVALFGLSTSGLAMYLAPWLVPAGKVRERLGVIALVFSASIPLCLLVIGRLRLTTLRLPLFFLAPSVPFFLGGLVLAAAFTHFGGVAGRFYAADLAGASLGCLAVIPLLGVLGGMNAGLALALLPAGAAALLSFGLVAPARRRLAVLSLGWMVAIALLVAANRNGGLIPLRVFKNPYDATRVFEAWNAYSRIAVMPQPADLPVGWGMSRRYEGPNPRTMLMNIDADAATVLVQTDGDPRAPGLAFLDYDVTAAGYRVKRPPGKVCIVGAGGGRDILTALRAGAEGVWAVEVNPLIVKTVNERFGWFTGRPYTLPGVHAVIDEGRAFLRRSGSRFDLIQLSLIDSWAATSSGAYVLTENSLYTLEAFETYLEHLAPGGMLSVTRWYYDRVHGETLRVAGLARAALERTGAARPADHIAVVKQRVDYKKLAEMGIEVATVLVSRDPLTPEQIQAVDGLEPSLGFDVVYRPQRNGDNVFWNLITGEDTASFYAAYPLDVRPPVDERPFFFQMVRLHDFWRTEYLRSLMPHAVLPVLSLGILALVAGLATLLFLILPLLLARRGQMAGRGVGASDGGRLLYFACLGVAFLSIEMPLLQRLILVLGRPIYALAVVLFSLLLSSSIGSAASQRVPVERLARRVSALLLVLVALLVAYAFGMPRLIEPLGLAAPWMRVAGCVALILPLGFLMGTAFPAGIRLLATRSPALIPWAWALNGAFSVTSSVAALILAMSLGFVAPFLLGAASYAAAALLLVSVFGPDEAPRTEASR